MSVIALTSGLCIDLYHSGIFSWRGGEKKYSFFRSGKDIMLSLYFNSFACIHYITVSSTSLEKAYQGIPLLG